MKRVLLVGLVGLLALCAFGGAAVAEEGVLSTYFTLTELSLTVQLPNSWVARLGQEAQAFMDDISARGSAVGASCHMIGSLSAPSESNEAASEYVGFFALYTSDNPTPGITSYTAYTAEAFDDLPVVQRTPEQMAYLTLPPQELPITTVVEGIASRFVVSEYRYNNYTLVVASTIEHGQYMWIEFICESNADAYPQFMAFLKSCAFSEDAPPANTPTVSDPDAWRDMMEVLQPAFGLDEQGQTRARPEPVLEEDEIWWFIDSYETADSLLELRGLNPDTIHAVSVATAWYGQADLITVEAMEEEFCTLSATAMFVTFGSTSAEQLMDCLQMMRDGWDDLSAIATAEDTYRFYTWNGANIILWRKARYPLTVYMFFIDMVPYRSLEIPQ
ncbi:MAG: hypothetical protein LBM74_04535 [Oscillospiraceae bacterium]|jgi:hypothetical protein|nr:hypothetical protein [Oscillospiraceae bacterium]